MIPRATYRLQFHAGFTFDDGAALAPYLAELGISHVYASPILTARAGSIHGYDVVDHGAINPELGGEAGFLRLAQALKAQGLGIILDIVPNHMAVGGGDNAQWLDVLTKGPASQFAPWFDIDFEPPDNALAGKLLAPFLGAPYGEVLGSGDLALWRDERTGGFVVAYHHHLFPIRPEDQAEIAAGPERFADPAHLHELLERQNFRLAWWRVAGDEINWRRFFDVTELAGLRVERDDVFESTHRIAFRLYEAGLIDGVRVDHIDGLTDPAGYCRRLRARLDALAPDRTAWVIVEKILGADETLPRDWGVNGTTGYDFMNAVSALQHAGKAEAVLGALWRDLSGRPAHFEAEECAARDEILATAFDAQHIQAARRFHEIARASPDTRDLTQAALRRGIAGIIRHLRVYRSYATGADGSPPVGKALERAADRAVAETPGDAGAIRFIASTLAGSGAAEAARRFNQLTAPVAAKAVEDTAFYRYGRLLSRADVGFEAGRLALGLDEFHAQMRVRAADWPAAMLATATHDHKRGEDMRARLAVLSEVVDVWEDAVGRWMSLNRNLGQEAIAPGDEYQLYQTLVGAWPPDLDPADAPAIEAFSKRVGRWQEKALREAKLGTSWASPDPAYESARQAFREAVLDPKRSGDFLEDLARFVGKIGPAGALNGLVQLTLRLTIPGVPDTYQGTEFWDFSLVDPDNRRPIDFEARREALAVATDLADLAAAWHDGRIKQRAMQSLLRLRAAQPALFADGDYAPLDVEGKRRDHVLAFSRRAGGKTLIVAVPLHVASPVWGAAAVTPPAGWWEDTRIAAGDAPGPWTDILRGRTLPGGAVALSAMTDAPALVLFGSS